MSSELLIDIRDLHSHSYVTLAWFICEKSLIWVQALELLEGLVRTSYRIHTILGAHHNLELFGNGIYCTCKYTNNYCHMHWVHHHWLLLCSIRYGKPSEEKVIELKELDFQYCAGSTSICTNGQLASTSKLFVFVLNNVILCAYKHLSAQKQCNRIDK